MALLWEREQGGRRYEIRSAGNTVRLYRDGVLHTQYNPKRTLTLGVWDLLLMPAFALPRPPRRVLLLGVGGGAALHLYRRFFPDAGFVAVDLDPLHLELARRFFLLDGVGVRLVEADARDWMRGGAEGFEFDVVIDDVFAEDRRGPQRVFEADAAWFEELSAPLSADGVLVMNFVSMSSLVRCAWMRRTAIRRALPGGLALRMPHYANAVAALYRQRLDAAALRRAVLANVELARLIRSGQFNFAVQSLRASE